MSSSSLARNSTLQIAGKMLGTAVGLATFYFLLHFFGTEGYGYLNIALTYVSLFAVIVDFGLTLTTAQLISEKGANEERILGNLLSLRVITAAIFLAIAPISALFIPEVRVVLPLVIIASASSFFASVAQVFIGVFQKRISLTVPVLAETANRIIALALILAIGYSNPTLTGAAFAFFAGGMAQLMIMLAGTSRIVLLRPAFDFSIWKTIIGKSWPIGISIFFNLLYLKGDIFFMTIFGRGAEEIGQYGAAYKVVDVVTMFPVTFMGLMLPLLARNWSAGDKPAFGKHLQNTFDIFALVAIPFSVGAIMLGEPLMLLVKSDLILAGQVLAILGPAAAVVFFNSLYGHAVVAVNRQRVMTLAYVFVAIIAVTGYVLYIPDYGAWAAAWVTLVAETCIGLLSFVVVALTTRSLPNLAMFFRSIIATTVMALALTFVPMPHVLVQILLGIAVFALVLPLVGGPSVRSIIKLFLKEQSQASA